MLIWQDFLTPLEQDSLTLFAFGILPSLTSLRTNVLMLTGSESCTNTPVPATWSVPAGLIGADTTFDWRLGTSLGTGPVSLSGSIPWPRAAHGEQATHEIFRATIGCECWIHVSTHLAHSTPILHMNVYFTRKCRIVVLRVEVHPGVWIVDAVYRNIIMWQPILWYALSKFLTIWM